MPKKVNTTKLSFKWGSGFTMETSSHSFLNRFLGPAVKNVVTATSFYFILKATSTFILAFESHMLVGYL